MGESPLPVSTPDMQSQPNYQAHFAQKTSTRAPELQSAPAELGPAHRQFTKEEPRVKHSLGTDKLRGLAPALLAADSQEQSDRFELDDSAPIRALRTNRLGSDPMGEAGQEGSSHLDAVAEEDEKSGPAGGGSSRVGGTAQPGGHTRTYASRDAGQRAEEGARHDFEKLARHAATAQDMEETHEETWGESFKIEWICTERLPFYRTRHIRNPWNHDREVKVSRDGTEIEPSIGQQLLEEWERLSEPVAAVGGKTAPAAGLRQGAGVTKSAPILTTASSHKEGGPSRS